MDPIDRQPLPRRHLLLLLVVFLVPSGLLTALAIRTLNQDRELSARREEDGRRQMVVLIRQEFVGRLEALKIRALSAAAEREEWWPDAPRDPADPIMLVARVEGGRLVLPWESKSRTAEVHRILAEQPFARLISQGEREELVRQRPLAASRWYKRALAEARNPAQAAAAELLVARALAKAGREADALAFARRTLAGDASLGDEHAVPYALYAARRISDSTAVEAADARAALSVVRDAATRLWVPTPAVHMSLSAASALAQRAPGGLDVLASAAHEAASAAVARAEQTLALQQAFPALAGQFPARSDRSEAPWLAFGPGPWLVGLSGDIGSRQGLLIAIDAQKVFARLESVARCSAAGGCGLALVSDAGSDEYPLGPALPALKLTGVKTAAMDGVQHAQHGFYVGALSLVLLLTAFGAYMLWRDVQRELRVAELRSQFVSSVSHELKTPLTAIRMFAETLRMGRPVHPALRDEYLDTIVSESERLTRLLNNVLDFSRIERGRKTYHFGRHDLATIVLTAARAMQYPLAQQGFELAVDVDQRVPRVRSDPDALEQAILNLLANALKYSGDARRIELRLARDATHAVISVRDWGIGIAPAEHRRIFEKFYRVATPENRRIPGTGLGLTLIDHIVRAHGGFVGMDSAPGAGSTFRIHLPVVDASSVTSDEDPECERSRTAVSEV